MKVTADELKVISRLVDDLCGIVLDESKGYLIESRLSDVAASAGCKTFSEPYCKVRYDNDATLREAIVDAITTNETLFFRDSSPFDVLAHKVLPDIADEIERNHRPKRLRIWSAACSTGQEVYSLAITIRELFIDIDAWDVMITGTDISNSAVKTASSGRYKAHEIQRGMKDDLLRKYFTNEGNEYKVCDELRSMATFRQFNLHDPFVGLGPFDIVMCRNVAIYFAPESRKRLFEKISRVLRPGGYLFVGASENLSDLGYQSQRHCRAIFYQPNAPKPAATAGVTST